MNLDWILERRRVTNTHEFRGRTFDGREVRISVDAAVDSMPDAVLEDLRRAMPGITNLDCRRDHTPDFFLASGFMLTLWACIASLGLGISLFLDMAGVADMGNAVWDEGLPIMGGYRLIVGLVRLWGAAFPVVAILIPIVLVWAFRYRDNKQASMKVGR